MNNAELDVNDSFTAAYAAMRQGGIWGGLGSGFNGPVDCIAIDDYGRIWFGGDFTTADGVTVNRITYWNGETFVPVGGATPGVNGRVRAIAIAANGEDIIFCGDFTSVAGVAYNRIARYAPASDTFSGYGTGLNGTGRALLVTRAGTLYVGGDFTTANGVTVNRVARWNGVTFEAISGGVNGAVYALAESIGGKLVVGGAFTTAGTTPTTVNRIAYYDTAWRAMGPSATPGVNGTVRAIEVTPEEWYIGGDFTTAGGMPANRIAGFNTDGFYTLAPGLDNSVYAIRYNPIDRRLWVGGDFTAIGSNTAAAHIATWSGTAWSHVDVDLPAGFTVTAIANAGERVYLGGDATGEAQCAGVTTLMGIGSAGGQPIFTVTRSGGTAAVIESFVNVTHNKRLTLRYALSNGETVRINLETRQMVSDIYGNIVGNIFADSDMGSWRIEAGTNVITTFASLAGGAAVTAYAQWQNYYRSIDGAGQ